jgi:hypothetical protein
MLFVVVQLNSAPSLPTFLFIKCPFLSVSYFTHTQTSQIYKKFASWLNKVCWALLVVVDATVPLPCVAAKQDAKTLLAFLVLIISPSHPPTFLPAHCHLSPDTLLICSLTATFPRPFSSHLQINTKTILDHSDEKDEKNRTYSAAYHIGPQ